ncbi:hypothetical protein INR49_012407 [Caranx melampygus]|nr:hypothetical protein INR49_012407 [Caranx melampygus]
MVEKVNRPYSESSLILISLCFQLCDVVTDLWLFCSVHGKMFVMIFSFIRGGRFRYNIIEGASLPQSNTCRSLPPHTLSCQYKMETVLPDHICRHILSQLKENI